MQIIGRRVTLPTESTLSSVRMTKKLPRLTELTAGCLSSEFTQTFIFLQALNIRLQHSTCATQLRHFEPDSDFYGSPYR